MIHVLELCFGSNEVIADSTIFLIELSEALTFEENTLTPSTIVQGKDVSLLALLRIYASMLIGYRSSQLLIS